MTTLKYFYERFKSQTPKALKALQKLLVGISGGSAAAIAVMIQYDMQGSSTFKMLTYLAVAAAFAVPMLQFSTTDTTLQKEDK